MFSRIGNFIKSKTQQFQQQNEQKSKSESNVSTPTKQNQIKQIPKKEMKETQIVNENIIEIKEPNGIQLFQDYSIHCNNFINDFGRGLELMMDFSEESSSVAIKRAEKLNENLKKMENLTFGLEKYINEMVMIAQTPKPTISNEITPYRRQRNLENLIITQINESDEINSN